MRILSEFWRIMTKCKKIKPDGGQCRANALKNSDFCFSHSPEYAEKKALATRKGGLNRKLYGVYGNEIQIKSPKDVKRLLSDVINGVWTGQMPANQPANTLGFLARCWLDAHEKGELLERIENIETVVKDWQK